MGEDLSTPLAIVPNAHCKTANLPFLLFDRDLRDILSFADCLFSLATDFEFLGEDGVSKGFND